MRKSKRAWKRIVSFLVVSAGFIFLSLLLILHIAFPVKYNDIIMPASKKYDIDVGIIRAVIWTESKYKKNALSNKGATGLMQLLPDTANFVAGLAGYKDFDVEMLYDEKINIDLGVFYLKYLFDKFGSEEAVLAAYNAGEGNVAQWQEKGVKEIPFKETREYVKRVAFVKKIYHFKSK